MVNPYRFYTYAYLREDRTPYYIGKGTRDRITYHYHRVGAKPPKDKSRIIFLKQNLTEEEAFKHEIYMITVFGRIDLGTGILHNKTNGGEGVCGHIHSEETKKKISDAKKGQTLSAETKKKMSESRKGRVFSEETKLKIKKSKENISEETRKKQSEAKKGKPFSGTRICLKGFKWWNDGEKTKLCYDCPGDGWILGRLYFLSGLTKEQMSENGRKNGLKHKENKTGFFKMSLEEKREVCKKINNQKWKCLETGYITTPGPLTRYQKSRGIDITKRIRIE